MADKHVEIEILQEELETVTNTTVTQYITNPGASTALLNTGQQTVTASQNYIEKDITANGIPNNVWNGVGFGGGGAAYNGATSVPDAAGGGGGWNHPAVGGNNGVDYTGGGGAGPNPGPGAGGHGIVIVTYPTEPG